MFRSPVSLAIAFAALALVAPAWSRTPAPEQTCLNATCLQWYCSESGIIWICGDHQQQQFCQACPSDC